MAWINRVFSRRVDSTARMIALAVLFISILVVLYSRYAAQQADMSTLTNLETPQVREIRVGGRSFSDYAHISLIVSELRQVTTYTFKAGGCFVPTRMIILLHSGTSLQLAVALVPENNAALIQVVNNDLPPCIYGRPLYSEKLPQILSEIGVKL